MKSSDQFMTPPDLLEACRVFLNGIDFDPASNNVAQKYVQAETYAVHPEEFDTMPQTAPGIVVSNGLKQDWRLYRSIFCNPPYSAGTVDRFVDKLVDTQLGKYNAEKGHYEKQEILFLVQSSTDAKWYHNLLNFSTGVLFFRGRPKFWRINLEEGEAHEKWVGQTRKARGETKPHNAPMGRYSLFYSGWNYYRFYTHFSKKGYITKTGLTWL